MKLKFLILSAAFCLIVLAVYSQIKTDLFAPAKDFPRDALVYIQITDLPAFIKLWNESKLKENYLESDNFKDFQNQHLGRKLASRWKEFNTAIGFKIDLEMLAGLVENQAAFALYDVGKLEFVFIAPISDEVFAATKFLQNKDKFAEEILADGTIIYRVSVEADRGRQIQELIFTHSKGRLIVATSEKLIAQTLNNISERSAKNSLANDPSFWSLSEKVSPNLATVWINQTALNNDYYFKRYWLMSDVKDLKNIRAGMFDFEIQENKLVEKRKFLLNKNTNIAPIDSRQSEKLLALLPENIPFYNLQKVEKDSVNQAVQKTISYRNAAKKNQSFAAFNYEYEDYRSTNDSFDEKIDETADFKKAERTETLFDFSKMLQSANPQSVLTFAEPKVLPAPLFIEFDRAAIFYLDSPNAFNRTNFEEEILRNLLQKTMISAPNVELNWETKTENSLSRRELKLPMLNWKVCYFLRGNELILTNDADLLQRILTINKELPANNSTREFNRLTVIDTRQKEAAFDRVFNRLAEKTANDSFFQNNISGLFDSISEVEKIEIKSNYSANILNEEVIFHLKN